MQVGKDLMDVYWRPGNGAMFLDLVQQLTGKPLAAVLLLPSCAVLWCAVCRLART